ncbi:MAG: Nif3-like dinuclear metal center hexameric protein [Campylobacter sp.]|nr:Nif3-like dinuclear metal center hexameric protein [Campylobacter sp.]
MKVSEIYTILNSLAPFEDSEQWDNSGLLVGNFKDEFDKIYVSLDLDSKLVLSLEENSLIITHHPLIFKGIKRVDTSKYPGNLLGILIKKDIKLISMHTNFDKHILNKFVMSEILGLEISHIDEFLVYAKFSAKFSKLCDLVKLKFGIENLRVTEVKDEINSFALCTGSGMDLADNVKADVFLTGDIKYHDALAARENGLNLIDITHFESEKYFGQALAKSLQNLGINAIITNSTNPFSYK